VRSGTSIAMLGRRRRKEFTIERRGLNGGSLHR
jgi:hypothetical protein